MGAGHAHALYVHEHSRLHRAAPEAKLIAVLGFVLCVATTPRRAVWAFALYAISYRTRQLETANQIREKQIKQLERDIAVLRAERSYLMRPQRLEPLARKLGMRPVRGDQFMALEDVPVKQRQR